MSTEINNVILTPSISKTIANMQMVVPMLFVKP